MSDHELLNVHFRSADAAAFAELVRRHASWLHGVARRRLGRDDGAEDVVQAVFFLLHRKAPRFKSDAALMSWLHRTAGYAATVIARTEARRKRRETEACMRRQQSTESPAETELPDAWRELAPVLDEMIDRLGRRDREALLVRFYRQMSFAEVGQATGSSEEAARKRVDRALEKLRQQSQRKHLRPSDAGLGVVLLSHSADAVPDGLIASTVGGALAAPQARLSPYAGLISEGISKMVLIQRLKLVAGLLLASGIIAGTGLVLHAGSALSPASQSAETGEYPKLAPYAASRWVDGSPQVQIKDQWVDLQAINDTPVPKIIEFAKDHYDDLWQKRFEEDLVQVLCEMGNPPALTVTLTVRDANAVADREVKDVPMTHENRRAIMSSKLTGSDKQ